MSDNNAVHNAIAAAQTAQLQATNNGRTLYDEMQSLRSLAMAIVDKVDKMNPCAPGSF